VTVGEHGEIGAVERIKVHRLGCRTAREAARRIRAKSLAGGLWALRCAQRGCQVRAARTRCTLAAIKEVDGLVGGLPPLNPVQRLACRRGSRTMSAFLVVTPELTYGD
jgi:hypothetical protein